MAESWQKLRLLFKFFDVFVMSWFDCWRFKAWFCCVDMGWYLTVFFNDLCQTQTLRWFLRGCIAVGTVASPIAAPHHVAARIAGDLPTSLESHLSVVPPIHCTLKKRILAAATALGYVWTDNEDSYRSHGRKVVTR